MDVHHMHVIELSNTFDAFVGQGGWIQRWSPHAHVDIKDAFHSSVPDPVTG